MIDWLRQHEGLITWIGIASGVMFVGSLIAVPLVVARIPANYFATAKAPPLGWQLRHPALRFIERCIKNGLGAILILAGIAMLVLPGQGILTIALGLILCDFPGKRALELRLVKRPSIRKALDWLRRKAGKEPLVVLGDE